MQSVELAPVEHRGRRTLISTRNWAAEAANEAEVEGGNDEK